MRNASPKLSASQFNSRLVNARTSVLNLAIAHEPRSSAIGRCIAEVRRSERPLPDRSDAEQFARALLEFREELGRAAKLGVEYWLAWHMVALWIVEPIDRIFCYSRVVAGLEDPDVPEPTRVFLRADCLCKIAEVHREQGRRDEARKFYEEALVAARASSNLQGNAAVAGSGLYSLEGSIAAALLTLDAEPESLE